VAKKYGVLTEDGFCDRVIYIIDKNGIIRFVDQNDLDDLPENEVLFKALRELR